MKTNEELIEVYVELVNKNPRVVMLIEPFVQTVIILFLLLIDSVKI